jgi:hypothetical protein
MNIKRSVSKALGAALLALAAITPMSAANAAVTPELKHVTVDEAPILLAQYGYRNFAPRSQSYQWETRWGSTPYGSWSTHQWQSSNGSYNYNYQYRFPNRYPRYNNCNPWRTY